MESVNVFLLLANFAGVALNASQECVSVLTSLFLKLAVWECSSREELVADLALQHDATIVDAFLTTCRYTIKRANILNFLACRANVATSAPKEEILAPLSFMVTLTVWEFTWGLVLSGHSALFRRY